MLGFCKRIRQKDPTAYVSPSGEEMTYTKVVGENAKSLRLTEGVWKIVLTSNADTSTACITVAQGGFFLIVRERKLSRAYVELAYRIS